MDSVGGLATFFYNLIPGAVLLFILDITKIYPLDNFSYPPTEKVLFILLLGSFLGFFGQGIIKIIKNHCINECIFSKVKNSNKIYEKIYKKACKYLEIPYDNPKEVFYSMDNYLRNSGSPYIINQYAEKAAFWGNTFLGSIVLFILINLYDNSPDKNSLLIICLILFSVSLYLTFTYIRTQYESILQTYVQKINHLDKRKTC